MSYFCRAAGVTRHRSENSLEEKWSHLIARRAVAPSSARELMRKLDEGYTVTAISMHAYSFQM